jgi:hypothetical protein
MTKTFGHITAFNWFQSSLITIIADIIVVDVNLSLVVIKIKSKDKTDEKEEQIQAEEEDEKDPLNVEDLAEQHNKPTKKEKDENAKGKSLQNKFLECLNVVNWVGTAACWLKRLRSVSYDGWLTVGEKRVNDRDFVYLSHLLDDQYNIVFN